MKKTTSILIITLLAGCAGSPPKPPMFKGEYKPINKVKFAKTDINPSDSVPSIFDFKFEGDITDSLKTLKKIQPQIKILAPIGSRVPLQVKIDLHDTNLEQVLNTISEQGGKEASLVFNNNTLQQGGNQVFISFSAKPLTDKVAVPKVFNFKFYGDITDVLTELNRVQPQLNVMPYLGHRLPLLIRIDVENTTLDQVLQTIGKQAGVVAKVVYNVSREQGGNQIFIDFI